MDPETKQETPQKPVVDPLAAMAMSEAEAKAIEDETYAETVTSNPTEEEPAKVEPEIAKDANALPDWVEFPAGFKIPPNKQLAFMMFRARWTDRPDKGDRWCLLWPLTDAEEKLAIKRTRGENGRMLAEFSKGMIRIADSKKVNWTGDFDPATEASPDRFWDEIGAKCRQMIQNFYLKTHQLDREEQADFFKNCLHVRTAKVG